MKTIPMRGGDRMPVLGLGTWKSTPGEIGTVIREAIRLGYRHFDCAPIYANEAEIGEALAACLTDGLVRRQELWITSKLWNDSHQPEDAAGALERTLHDLKLDYLDLYLIHWPVALRKGVFLPQSPADFLSLADVPIATTWSALEAAADRGLCRHIGVSNFSVASLGALLKTARIKPEVNQVEMHPYLQQGALVEFCQQQGIAITAYSPLGSVDRPAGLKQPGEPVLIDDPAVRAVAARHNVTPAQALLAWALARGLSVIPKSVRTERLRENLAAAELTLTAADLQALAGLDRDHRYLSGAFWAIPGSPYTLTDLWGQ